MTQGLGDTSGLNVAQACSYERRKGSTFSQGGQSPAQKEAAGRLQVLAVDGQCQILG